MRPDGLARSTAPTPAAAPPAALPPEQGAERLPRRLLTATLVLLFVVLVIYLLDELASILQPLFIAIFILYALRPVKDWLSRRGVPNWLAYLLTLAGVLCLLVVLGALVYANLGRLNPQRFSQFREALGEQLNGVLRAVGVHTERPLQVRDLLPGSERFDVPKQVSRVAGTFFGFLTASVVVLVYLFFLVLEMEGFPGRLRDALGPERADSTLSVVGEINDAIGRYLSVMVFLSLVQGALCGGVLAGLGVELFLLWGLLIAAFNFVPYLGILGVVLPVLLTFVQFPHQPWRGVVALVLLSVIQGVADNWVRPRMMGRQLGVSPLLVLLAISFWGWLWGAVGLILAVPLTVALKIVLEHVPATKPVAVLMKDR